MKNYERLLIIAGTGRNSGKTTLACSVIESFSSLGPVAVKISPHFHEPTDGLVNWHINKDYNIYRETSVGGGKDTSRMLLSGAVEAYLIQAYNSTVKKAFDLIYSVIPPDVPVVCESPALAKYLDPGVLLITDNKEVKFRKELSSITGKADKVFCPLIHEPGLDRLVFSAGRWFFS